MKTVPGGGLIPQAGQLYSGLIYTQSGSCDRLVLLGAVTPTAKGQRLLSWLSWVEESDYEEFGFLSFSNCNE